MSRPHSFAATAAALVFGLCSLPVLAGLPGPVVSSPWLVEHLDHVTVLDVRQDSEYAERHVEGAIGIPLHELLSRLDEVPAGEVWVHCASGYRASIAEATFHRAHG